MNVRFYGEVWPAAFQLCHSLLDISLENKKTIELGCGLAIPSIIASIKGAQASACDHNPDAQELVIKNSQHNHTEVAFHCIDWTRNYHLKPEYDLLMASDILYRPEQFSHIVRMFESLSKEDSTILVTDPGRVKREDFVGMMNHRFKLIQEVKIGDIWVMKWSKKKKSEP